MLYGISFDAEQDWRTGSEDGSVVDVEAMIKITHENEQFTDKTCGLAWQW